MPEPEALPSVHPVFPPDYINDSLKAISAPLSIGIQAVDRTTATASEYP